jgi:hypothetical protein
MHASLTAISAPACRPTLGVRVEGSCGPDRAPRAGVRAWIFGLSLFGLSACGATLPQAVQSAPPTDAFVEVPYPPPAALSELIPRRPREPGVVYVDGSWAWRGKYYVWQRGGWVLPRPGTRATLATLRYLPDGRAFFAESGWVDARGEHVRRPRVLVPSVTPPNEVTAEFQTGR